MSKLYEVHESLLFNILNYVIFGVYHIPIYDKYSDDKLS